MITFRQKGDFKKTTKFLEFVGDGDYLKGIETLAQVGVEALTASTPRRTGKTAESWSYSIDKTKNGVTIQWNNSNVSGNLNVAVLIQTGHGTGSGYYVEGIDYINPALAPIFDLIGKKAWEEVTDCAKH